jgi:LysR family hydrogen peroxide-inducible transcriptional activator
MKHEVTGRVRVGIIGTTARWLVPRLLGEMGSRHPGVSLEIVDATSTSLEPQLINGRLDLAVVNLPLPAAELTTTPLFDEDLLLFVPRSSALGDVEHEIELANIGDLFLFLPPRGTSFRDLLDDAAAKAGVKLVARAELDGLRLIASLVISGDGASILPATAVPTHLQGETKPIRVRGLPRRKVGVALRKRGLPGAPARAFLEVLHDLVEADACPEVGLHLPA